MTRHLMFSKQTAETARMAVEFYLQRENTNAPPYATTTAPFNFKPDTWLTFDSHQFYLLKDALRMHEQFLLDEASSSEEHIASMFHAYAIAPGTMLQAIERNDRSQKLNLSFLANLKTV